MKILRNIGTWFGEKLVELMKCKWGRALYGFFFGGLMGAILLKTGFLAGRIPDAEE
jgi:hypothetical protein